MAKEKKSTQETTSQPWAELQPYLIDLFSRGSTALGETPKAPYTGDFFAPATGNQQDALQGLFTAASGFGQGADEVRNLGIQTARGDFLSPESNPFLASTIDAAIRPVEEKYKFSLLPQVEDAAIGGGAYGGARQDLLKQAALEAFSREAGDLSSNIAFANYSAERGRQERAPALLEAGNLLSAAGPQTALAAGGVERGFNQIGLDNNLAQLQEQRTAPWTGLSQFSQLLGLGSPYGSSTATATQQLDPVAGLLQGLLGAGTLGLQAANVFGFPASPILSGMGGLWSG